MIAEPSYRLRHSDCLEYKTSNELVLYDPHSKTTVLFPRYITDILLSLKVAYPKAILFSELENALSSNQTMAINITEDIERLSKIGIVVQD